MVTGDELFLAMYDGRVLGAAIVAERDGELTKADGDRGGQGRVGVPVEAGVGQVGDQRLGDRELDDVGAVYGSGQDMRASLVETQQRWQLSQSAAVDVQGGGGELADPRAAR